MKSPYVSELDASKPVTGSFLVQSKEVREKKTGEPYLSLLLSDKTGKIDAKMWDNVAEVMDQFDRDDFVKVKAVYQLHMNRPQLTIHKIRIMAEEEVDFSDFFPSTARNVEEMWTELRAIVAGVGNPHLRALLDSMLDDEEIARRYRMAPAAKSIHHAFLGGLLEHVLSLCGLCRMTAAHYPHIDADLMITGAVLHDIGKIYELTYDRGFGYSSEGQLLGHIMLAFRMVGDKVAKLPDFPPSLRTLVEHLVLSHHGKLEFGSPKLPQFPEALLLHYLDDMDSKMECMRCAIDADKQSGNCFTAYHALLERPVLKKTKFLEPSVVSPEVAVKSEPEPLEMFSETVVHAESPKREQLAPPKPHSAPKRPSNSIFGDKLQFALISVAPDTPQE